MNDSVCEDCYEIIYGEVYYYWNAGIHGDGDNTFVVPMDVGVDAKSELGFDVFPVEFLIEDGYTDNPLKISPPVTVMRGAPPPLEAGDVSTSYY